MKKKLSDYELGWVVGILEGEGYFEYNGCSQKIVLRMCDFDTVETYTNIISRVLGVKLVIKAITPANSNAQEIYACDLSGERARTIMRLVAPYLHYRRRQKVWQSLNKYRGKKLRLASSGIDILEFAKKQKVGT